MRTAVRSLALLAQVVPMFRRPTGARDVLRALPGIYAVARLARAMMGPGGLALTAGLAGLGWLIARNRRGPGGARP